MKLKRYSVTGSYTRPGTALPYAATMDFATYKEAYDAYMKSLMGSNGAWSNLRIRFWYI